LNSNPLIALESLAIGTESRPYVGFYQQRVVHYTIIIEVEQPIAQAARDADGHKGRIYRVILRFQVVGQRGETGTGQIGLVRRIGRFRLQNCDESSKLPVMFS